jgi:hypothetical protein
MYSFLKPVHDLLTEEKEERVIKTDICRWYTVGVSMEDGEEKAISK